MSWIALRMLTGERSKYLGLIFGVTFATLLMTQQVSIFMGILTRTGNQILEVRDADIWVMDNRVLQVLYAIERAEHPLYVGQQLDVFIDGNNAVAGAAQPVTIEGVQVESAIAF